MAYNVFGNPITNQTLEGIPEYKGKTITRKDRAHVALNMEYAENKKTMALHSIEKFKQLGVSTLGLIYNATGDTITYIGENSWHGHIGSTPYPIEIANGQWGAFHHIKTVGRSSAAVVYRGLNYEDVKCDWMAAWSNLSNQLFLSSYNTVYTEIREEGHYTTHDHWDYISNLLCDSGNTKSDHWNGCLSKVAIGDDTSPIFQAIFTIEGA